MQIPISTKQNTYDISFKADSNDNRQFFISVKFSNLSQSIVLIKHVIIQVKKELHRMLIQKKKTED